MKQGYLRQQQSQKLILTVCLSLCQGVHAHIQCNGTSRKVTTAHLFTRAEMRHFPEEGKSWRNHAKDSKHMVYRAALWRGLKVRQLKWFKKHIHLPEGREQL